MWWAVVIPLKIATILPLGLLPQQSTTLGVPPCQMSFLGRKMPNILFSLLSAAFRPTGTRMAMSLSGKKQDG